MFKNANRANVSAFHKHQIRGIKSMIYAIIREYLCKAKNGDNQYTPCESMDV
jgi:hypothetical protein